MANKKKFRVYMSLELVTEDDGNSLDVVNVLRMSNEPVPLPMMGKFLDGLSKMAPKVMIVSQSTHGKDNQREKNDVDSDLDCEDFERGEASGMCDGMGHYHCDECKWRNPESIRQKHEDWLRHMVHKKDWPKIKARVIDTDEEVMVDDYPIVDLGTSYYNMWHDADNGITYHDDDLEFLEERLQKV